MRKKRGPSLANVHCAVTKEGSDKNHRVFLGVLRKLFDSRVVFEPHLMSSLLKEASEGGLLTKEVRQHLWSPSCRGRLGIPTQAASLGGGDPTCPAAWPGVESQLAKGWFLQWKIYCSW